MIEKIVQTAIKQTGSIIEPATLMAFIAVESGGRGFDKDTGRIIIQFEPAWFRRKSPYTPSGNWSLNGVERQKAEWIAFSDAFKSNPDAAMESTSIGLPQIMGFHWKRLGYESVGDMWDDFKAGEINQVKALIKFIETDKKLHKALLEKDWHLVAYIYNGAGYMALAHRLQREPYSVSMAKAYDQYSRSMQ